MEAQKWSFLIPATLLESAGSCPRGSVLAEGPAVFEGHSVVTALGYQLNWMCETRYGRRICSWSGWGLAALGVPCRGWCVVRAGTVATE